MREFRATPPTGGQEPEDPWAYRPAGRPPAAPDQLRPSWGAPAAYQHPRGTTVLVLGILSVVLLPFLGPFAWAMGHRALKEIDRSGVPAANRSMLVGGMVTGIIGTIFLVLGTLGFLIVVGLVATTSTYAG